MGALHSFSDYIQVSAIPEQKGLHDGRACVESLLASFPRTAGRPAPRILGQAADAGDEGTASILSDYVQQQEKLVWMLRAYLA